MLHVCPLSPPAAVQYVRHWAALRAAHAFQQWLSFALACDLRGAAAGWCSLSAAHDETSAQLAGARVTKEQLLALSRIAMLQASRVCEQLLRSQLRLKTAWCFSRWAQRACEYDACCVGDKREPSADWPPPALPPPRVLLIRP